MHAWRMFERVVIAAVTATVCFSISAALGRGGGDAVRISHIRHGAYAFFDGTNVECVNPKAGGGVACSVDYTSPRLLPPAPPKYDVSLGLSGLSITKFARSGKILWGKDLR